jgi:peptidoglycan/xylan/chitin deacetylase (PgdA/CDA1 family)
VLMYHNICDDPEPGLSPYYQTNTSPAVFRQHMQFLADHGYKTITVTDLVAALNTRSHSLSAPGGEGQGEVVPDRRVVLTFDDAFQSVYTEAFPVLQQHGFTASVFLPTAFIGDTRRQFRPASGSRLSTLNSQPSTTLDCLTWSEVAEMRRHGIEFGSHTVNHPELVKLSWLEIKSELVNSRNEIEQRLGEPATTFCYPFAFPQANHSFTQTLRALLVETGYSSCLTTRLGCVQPGDDPFSIKRLPANSLDDPAFLAAKLSGHYDWLAKPQSAVKRAKSFISTRSSQRSTMSAPIEAKSN